MHIKNTMYEVIHELRGFISQQYKYPKGNLFSWQVRM